MIKIKVLSVDLKTKLKNSHCPDEIVEKKNKDDHEEGGWTSRYVEILV